MKIDIFKTLNLKFLIGEIIGFIFILYITGYFFYKEDPLLMNLDLRFLFHLLPITVITLFYGIIPGFAYFILFTITAMVIYGSIDYEYFLSLLLFLLILSEFWFYWDKKLKDSEEKYKYAEEKLRDLARNLLLIKLSHDQLEKSYILKPISIRKVIFDIKKEILNMEEEDKILKKVFDLIVANFNIEKAALLQITENEKYKLLANTGNIESIDNKDPLIQRVIESRAITFITDIKDKETSKYLSVIPIYFNNNLRYLLVIEKMPFLALNRDNLLTINLIFEYVISDMEILREISHIYKKFGEFEIDFVKEMHRMFKLYDKFGKESSIIFIYIKGLEETIFELINLNIRGLDIITRMTFKNHDFQGLLILLPFTDIYGANVFMNRIMKVLREKFSVEYVEKNIKYKLFKIDNPEKLLLQFYDFEGF